MRVLGLDISSNVVAVVEMDTAFGRFEIRDTHESEFNPSLLNPTPVNPMVAAQQLVNHLPKLPDRIVTSVPAEISTFRNLQIATKDKKAIRAAVDFELEDDLPFERENLHYDSVILNAGAQGSLIHVGAVKKAAFRQHLADLNASGVDPDVITTEAWAYRSLFSRLDYQEAVLLISVEDQKTSFYVHYRNRPILYREVAFGLKSIARHLQQKLGANENEIKNWIQDVGLSGSDQAVSGAMAELFELLIPEIKQTELAARATLRSSIDQVLVTGPGALLPGLLQWFETATEKRVALFRPLSQLSPGAVTYSDLSEVRYAKALALAMTTVPSDKLHALNLRKGDFLKAGSGAGSPFELIKKPLPYILITSLVFFITKAVEYNYYQGKLSEADDTLKRAVKVYFGGISDSAARNYLASPDRLKRTIQNDVSKERELSKLLSPNPNSPLDLLKSLSQKVGKDIVVDMVHFDSGMENNGAYKENAPMKTTITFVVNNAQVLAKLTDTIERNFPFKHAASEEVSQEGRRLLKITFSGIAGGGKP